MKRWDWLAVGYGFGILMVLLIGMVETTDDRFLGLEGTLALWLDSLSNIPFVIAFLYYWRRIARR